MGKLLTIFVLGFTFLYYGYADVSINKNETKKTILTSMQDTVKTCISCHEDLMKFKNKHMPAEESCENCHLAKEENHSKEFFKGDALLERVPGLCYTCHEEKNTKKHVHVPVESGDCLDCHSVHSSDNDYLLNKKSVSNLCAECHDIEIPNYKSKHQPVTTGNCINCHDPHQSENRKMLKSKAPELCLSCHKKIKEEFNNSNLHIPFTENCNDCHEPHMSKQKHLLKDKVPLLCYTCHEEKNTKKNVHYPVEDGDCFSCHAPHSSQNAGLLNLPVSTTCYQCHDIDKSEFMHKPVKEGKCVDCHNPHQSDNTKLLSKKSPKLCFKCHANEKKESSMSNIHPPFDDNCSNCHKAHNSNIEHLLTEKVAALCFECHEQEKGENDIHKPYKDRECMDCHSPHASDEEKMLKEKETKVCLNCHSKIIKTEEKEIINIGQKLRIGKMQHGAIEMDGCTACHKPHTSKYYSLLSKEFPAYEYTKTEVKNFDLCFDCHDSKMLLKDPPPGTTDFRNGDKNLHYFHINGEKGRNCTFCHDVHASNKKHLIADKVLFGSWEMPLNYISYKNGGSCATGCHSKKVYINNTY